MKIHLAILLMATAISNAQPSANLEGPQAVAWMRSNHDASAYSGSVEGVLPYYADDAMLMPSIFNLVLGKESIRAWLTPDRTRDLMSPGAVSFTVLGSAAFLSGVGAKATGDTRNGGTLWILQRANDGSWQITYSIFTSGSLDNSLRMALLALTPVSLAVSLFAIIRFRSRWRILGSIPWLVVAAYFAVILIPAWLRDSASHHGLPLGLVVFLAPTVPYMMVFLAVRGMSKTVA